MLSKVVRTIHPVGQGGFYTEEFFVNNAPEPMYRIAYDCGGKSKRFIENYLKALFPLSGNKKIDALFLSHFHNDHINGLDYLLEHGLVKRLVIPKLTNGLFFESLIYNQLENRDSHSTNKLVVSIKKKSIGIPITEVSEFDKANLERHEQQDINELPANISSGTKISIDHDVTWHLMPFNTPLTNNTKELSFSDFLKQKLSINADKQLCEELPNIVKTYGLKKLKPFYEEFFAVKDQNKYSMPLFSGSEDYADYKLYSKENHALLSKAIKLQQLDCIVNQQPNFCNSPCKQDTDGNNPNCLYLGDFDTKTYFNELNSCYLNLWKSIYSIQAPHHGSINNHCNELYDYAQFCFISAGAANYYNHPHNKTLVDIQKKCTLPIIVTEDPKSKLVFTYAL